jgi:hypothetical protein
VSVTVKSTLFPALDPVLVLPFATQGGIGEIQVYYSVVADPIAVGLNIVVADFDQQRFRVFPVIRASVGFSHEGYRAIFGWLQIITRSTTATGDVDTAVDVPPVLADTGCPLADYGYLPTMFDAPANPHHPDGEWRADTFLAAIPDIGHSRQLAALNGFRWGYQLTAGKPTSLPVEPLSSDRWNHYCPMLAASYPSWSFLASTW